MGFRPVVAESPVWMAFPFIGGRASVSSDRSGIAMTAEAYRKGAREVHCGAFQAELQANPSTAFVVDANARASLYSHVSCGRG
ncbi:hypothetical protein FHS27_004444 [Rhodopirellula rubra]|uniref:Uncharacterized protein n=1 Tax=Aporhodopirellula rubra TaxID=980271 RepID=A0A7W5H6J1_9BACT|nr:hypothetical protein [Aporhodopirellula rubra]